MKTRPSHEELCEAAAAILERAFPVAEPLRPRPVGPGTWRRARFAVAAACAACAVSVGVLVPVLAPRHERPVEAFVERGRWESPAVVAADRDGARVRFSDGTRVELAPGARAAIHHATTAGAEVRLLDGGARFDVVPRPGARWTASAGPVTVHVTGTRFDLRWARDRRLVRVDLHEGSVRVTGAGAPGRALTAGESIELAVAPVVAMDERDARDEAIAGAARRPAAVMPPGRRRSAPRRVAAEAPRTRVDHAPTDAPRVEPPAEAPRPRLAAGGAACEALAAQFRFDDSAQRFWVQRWNVLAFTDPRIDLSRSWCGPGSLAVDARFDATGAKTSSGPRPHEAGEIILKPPRPLDLRGRTVSLRFFVEASADVRFQAMLFAVSHSVWNPGAHTRELTPGRWWTLTHTFSPSDPVDLVDKITFQIQSAPSHTTWRGRVFLDHVAWQ